MDGLSGVNRPRASFSRGSSAFSRPWEQNHRTLWPPSSYSRFFETGGRLLACFFRDEGSISLPRCICVSAVGVLFHHLGSREPTAHERNSQWVELFSRPKKQKNGRCGPRTAIHAFLRQAGDSSLVFSVARLDSAPAHAERPSNIGGSTQASGTPGYRDGQRASVETDRPRFRVTYASPRLECSSTTWARGSRPPTSEILKWVEGTSHPKK